MQDLTLLTDEEFETLRASVMSEQIKRNRMREIPEEVRALKSQFESFGGTAELATMVKGSANSTGNFLLAELTAVYNDGIGGVA